MGCSNEEEPDFNNQNYGKKLTSSWLFSISLYQKYENYVVKVITNSL